MHKQFSPTQEFGFFSSTNANKCQPAGLIASTDSDTTWLFPIISDILCKVDSASFKSLCLRFVKYSEVKK